MTEQKKGSTALAVDRCFHVGAHRNMQSICFFGDGVKEGHIGVAVDVRQLLIKIGQLNPLDGLLQAPGSQTKIVVLL